MNIIVYGASIFMKCNVCVYVVSDSGCFLYFLVKKHGCDVDDDGKTSTL